MERATGNRVQPAAQRREPDSEERRLHPRADAHQLAASSWVVVVYTLEQGSPWWKSEVQVSGSDLATPCGRGSLNSGGARRGRAGVDAVAALSDMASARAARSIAAAASSGSAIEAGSGGGPGSANSRPPLVKARTS